MYGTGPRDVRTIASEIERHTAQLFHLKAGLARIQAEIDDLLTALEEASPTALAAAEHSETPPVATAPALEESRQELVELDKFITALEGAVATKLEPSCEAVPAAMLAPRRHPDDLTRIKGCNAAAAAKLAGLGFDSFVSIANLTAADLVRIGVELGDARRISRENWIEQAALLRSGTATHYDTERQQSGGTASGIVTANPQPYTHRIKPAGATSGELVDRAMRISGGIGTRMLTAASIVAVLVGLQSVEVDLRPAIIAPHLHELASCGSAVLAGNPACAGVTWSRS